MNRKLALATLGLAFGATALHADDRLAGLLLLSDVAPDAIQITPHVPHMGEHWALPQNLPGGPIYCAIDGRVVCIEYMFDASDLADGVNFEGLMPDIETPPIAHIDMQFLPDGVPPHPVPLYQLHIYFAAQDVLAEH